MQQMLDMGVIKTIRALMLKVFPVSLTLLQSKILGVLCAGSNALFNLFRLDLFISFYINIAPHREKILYLGVVMT